MPPGIWLIKLGLELGIGHGSARRSGAACPRKRAAESVRAFSARGLSPVATDTENALATRAESLRAIAEVA